MSDQTSSSGLGGLEPSVSEPQSPVADPAAPATTVDQPAPVADQTLEARVSALESAVGQLDSRVSTLEQAPSPAPAPSADPAAPAGDGTTAPVVPDDPAQAIVARVEAGDRGPVIHQLGQMLGKAGYSNTVSQGKGDVFDQSVADALAAYLADKQLELPLESLITSEAWQALEQDAAAAATAADAAPTTTTPDPTPATEATP